jgi:PLP dependent protein
MRAIRTPLTRNVRSISENEYVTVARDQSLHLSEQGAPFAEPVFIMPEDDPRPLGQSGDAGGKVTNPRIGHQPDFGERVAAMHLAAYSAAMSDPETRLATVRAAIAKASKMAGRPADATTLIAVSKTKSTDEITPLITAGQCEFGENRVQEAQAKWPALLAETPGIRMHLVGQLQSNKADDAVALFDVIHSVDRPSLVAALARAQAKTVRRPECFIQVDIGNEPQKGGCPVADLPALLAEAQAVGLNIVGLMAVPPADLEPAPYFALLAKLARDHGLDQLSMGMSGDFETAVKLGATHVRVGTALFGVRA